MIPLLVVGCAGPEDVTPMGPVWAAEQRAPGNLPVWGGTIAVDGERAVLSDPDGDRVLIVDTAGAKVQAVVELEPGSAPFRVAIDGDRAFVTLRGSGQLAELDLAAGSLTSAEPVCAEPRGVVVDPSTGTVYVACAEGTVVIDDGLLPVAIPVGPDLRDVVIADGHLWVSQFRGGNVYELGLGGEGGQLTHPFGLDVAWRLKVWNDAPVVLGTVQTTAVIDRGLTDEGMPGAYGSATTCGGVVGTTLVFERGSSSSFTSPLMVDFATHDGYVAVVSAARGAEGAGPVTIVPVELFACLPEVGRFLPQIEGHAVAIEYDAVGRLLVQMQQPLALLINGQEVTLGVDTTTDPAGRAAFSLFHEATEAGLACASCHGEGQDDGHVWQFRLEDGVEIARRTLPLSGSLASRAPYHWGGDLPTLSDLMLDTFTAGMQGRPVTWDEQAVLLDWLDGVRTTQVAPPAWASEVDLGERLFRDPAVGCAGCHSGPAFTDNRLWDVRPFDDEGPLKTPSLLGVGARRSLMHDGCAETLEERFYNDMTCTGGGAHGETRYLGPKELDALISYLRTL